MSWEHWILAAGVAFALVVVAVVGFVGLVVGGVLVAKARPGVASAVRTAVAASPGNAAEYLRRAHDAVKAEAVGLAFDGIAADMRADQAAEIKAAAARTLGPKGVTGGGP